MRAGCPPEIQSVTSSAYVCIPTIIQWWFTSPKASVLVISVHSINGYPPPPIPFVKEELALLVLFLANLMYYVQKKMNTNKVIMTKLYDVSCCHCLCCVTVAVAVMMMNR